MANYLKLHRKMLEWGWYKDVNTCRLFIHCLLKANWKAGEWQGINYSAGEFITSLETLAKETNLTISQVRTAIDHLKMTGEIASKSQGKTRIITVNNWNEYQEDSKVDSRIIAGSSQDNRKVVATDIEVKKDNSKEEKNISNININNIKRPYGDFENVKLSDSELEKLNNEFGIEETRKAIQFLDEYIEMKGYKAKSHYLAMRKWVFNAVKEDEARKQKTQTAKPAMTDAFGGNVSNEVYAKVHNFKNERTYNFDELLKGIVE